MFSNNLFYLQENAIAFMINKVQTFKANAFNVQ